MLRVQESQEKTGAGFLQRLFGAKQFEISFSILLFWFKTRVRERNSGYRLVYIDADILQYIEIYRNPFHFGLIEQFNFGRKPENVPFLDPTNFRSESCLLC